MGDFFHFFAPRYYHPVYITCLAVVGFCYLCYYSTSSDCNILLKKYSVVPTLLLTAFLVCWIGFRPVSGTFCDMTTYATEYNRYLTGIRHFSFDIHDEFFFRYIQSLCASFRLSTAGFFIVCAAINIGASFLASRRLVYENSFLAFLFVLSSFCYFEFCVNGVRNGLACSCMALAIVLIATKKYFVDYLIAGAFIFVAYGFHHSTLIPIAAVIGSFWVVKKVRYSIMIWFACLGLYFVFGNFFISIMDSVSWDNRAAMYASSDYTQFRRLGFRWDFVIYSIFPIILAWYIEEKRGIKDKTFQFLANTYILANAAWVLINSIAFSNRFAYLSWFLYPYLLSYAFIRIPLWKDQDKKCGILFFAYLMTTVLLFIIL